MKAVVNFETTVEKRTYSFCFCTYHKLGCQFPILSSCFNYSSLGISPWLPFVMLKKSMALNWESLLTYQSMLFV